MEIEKKEKLYEIKQTVDQAIAQLDKDIQTLMESQYACYDHHDFDSDQEQSDCSIDSVESSDMEDIFDNVSDNLFHIKIAKELKEKDMSLAVSKNWIRSKRFKKQNSKSFVGPTKVTSERSDNALIRLAERIKAKWKSSMIDSTGWRMQYFHYLTTLIYVVDFYMTGFIMGNHEIF